MLQTSEWAAGRARRPRKMAVLAQVKLSSRKTRRLPKIPSVHLEKEPSTLTYRDCVVKVGSLREDAGGRNLEKC